MKKNRIIWDESNPQQSRLRSIRSFACRKSSLKKRQKEAIDNFWFLMGVDYQEKYLDFSVVFNRDAPVTLEIGFGMGSSLVTMASQQHEKNFLGIEVYRPGIGACITRAKEANLSNLRIVFHDAVEVLENMIENQSLSRIQLFFPDPWNKRRHHKRRIMQPYFVTLIARKLMYGGIFHMATDSATYASYTLKVLSDHPGFHNMSPKGCYVQRPDDRPLTKFEKRSQHLNVDVWDLIFENSMNNGYPEY